MSYILEGKDFFKKILFRTKVLFIPVEDNNYAPQFLQSKILLYSVIFLLLLKIVEIGFFIPFPKNIFFADITRIDLVNLLNENRKSLGLNSLTESEKLDEAAYLKARDMVEKGYFYHESPEGITPWFWFSKVGYNYKYAGENLAIGFVNSQNVYDAWLNSPSHKENLLNPDYKEVGTAVLQGFKSNNAIIVVQLFAKPSVLNTTNKKNQEINNKPTEDIIKHNTSQDSENQLTPKNTTVGEKVLSQSTEYLLSQKTKNNAGNNIYYKFINFIVYDNDKILRYFSYGFLTLITICLLLNIFINFKIQQKEIIFRSIILITLVYISIFLNKNIVNQIIPYYITLI